MKTIACDVRGCSYPATRLVIFIDRPGECGALCRFHYPYYVRFQHREKVRAFFSLLTDPRGWRFVLALVRFRRAIVREGVNDETDKPSGSALVDP